MPTTFPWLFVGKEGKELARYCGVQRAYAGDKVIDESLDDGQRLGELIDLQGDNATCCATSGSTLLERRRW